MIRRSLREYEDGHRAFGSANAIAQILFVLHDGPDYASVPWPSRAYILVWAADREINNGGRCQFFFNGHGFPARDVVRGLVDIGATKKATVHQATMNPLPEGFLNAAEENSEALTQYENNDTDSPFCQPELDEAWFRGSEDLEPLLLTYAEAHSSTCPL